jgi:hypothetical protein
MFDRPKPRASCSANGRIKKVNVKLALEQTTKADMGSIGTALLSL